MTRKTREAVQAALNHLENALSTKDGRDMVRIGNARALLAEALAEPERECDVGTAEEQFKRYHKFCMDGYGCSKCVVGTRSGAGCSLAWSQMPYNEGGTE